MIATQPILIVGAGPVGLTLALALKRQGVTVRIIDKNDGPTDKSKALVIWPRTLDLLDCPHVVALLIVEMPDVLAVGLVSYPAQRAHAVGETLPKPARHRA